MRRLLARVLRIPDRWEERLLETAMRTTPRPVVPSGLRDRLVADALVAAEQASPRPRRPFVWAAWAAPAALAAVLAWVAFLGHREKPDVQPPTGGQPVVSAPAAPDQPEPRLDPPGDERTTVVDARPSGTQRKLKVTPGPKPRQGPPPVPPKPETTPPLELVAEADTTPSETPKIRVTVSRTREGDAGYARAASWNEDGTRTEWAILEGAEAQGPRSEVCMNGDAGLKLCVTVSSDSTRDKLEDRL